MIKEIFDVGCEYSAEHNQYAIVFGLKDDDGDEVTCSGDADIIIFDADGKVIYENNFEFDSDDFLEVENSDNFVRPLCAFFINRDEIKKSTTPTGTVKLIVNAEDFEDEDTGMTFDIIDFEPKPFIITDLPFKLNITLPNLPLNITNDHENTVIEIQTVDTECRCALNSCYYDLSLIIDVKVVSKKRNINKDDTVWVRYKIYDSKNKVVESELISGGDIGLGETTTLRSRYIKKLDYKEKYLLKITDCEF